MDPEENSFEDSRVSDVDAVPSEFAFSAPKVHRKLPPMYAKLFGSVDAGPLQPTESCQDAIEEFKAILAKRADDRAKSHESYKVIPQFYFRKKPAADSSLLSRVQREANRLHLLRLVGETLTDAHLKAILDALQSHVSPPKDGTDRINYDDFCTVRDIVTEMTPLAAPYFTATAFLKFPRDEHDRISTRLLFQYICGSVGLRQTRIRLSSYDEVGDGYLREYDLETYINDVIPTLANLRSLQDNFKPFYVFTAVRKFMYFLDPSKSGKISIRDIVGSKVMAELLALQSESFTADKASGGSTSASGGKAGTTTPPPNWFSSSNALRVYGQYLELDTDMNGMLSKEEMQAYAGGTFTHVFFDRLFQECLTYGGEMDFKMYLDFVLTMENRNTPEAITFMFRLLDLKRQGYLDAPTIGYFFKEVTSKLVAVGHEPVNAADVQDEIFDMVHPADPFRITLEDLKSCKQGHTIVFMLVDCNAFWQYDNRESLMQQKEEEEAEK